MKLLIISGGSRGLGAELVRLYQQSDWQILEFSRSAPHRFSGPGSASVACDFSRPAELQERLRAAFAEAAGAAAAAGAQWDEVLAINNAAVLQPIGPLARLEAAEIAASTQVNVTSALVFFAEVIRGFGDSRLRMAQISSGAARHGYAGWSLYCAGKAAMNNAVDAIAAEGHQIIAIDPGLIDTDMQAEIRSRSREDFPAVQKFIQRQRDGLLQPPAAVAAAVQQICSLPQWQPGSIVKARPAPAAGSAGQEGQ